MASVRTLLTSIVIISIANQVFLWKKNKYMCY